MDNQIAEILAKYAPSARIKARIEAEAKARTDLETLLSKPTPQLLNTFLVAADMDRNQAGSMVQDRFGVAFRGQNGKDLRSNKLEVVIDWMRKLWEVPEEGCIELVGRFRKEKPIQGAGATFISLILYLRNPRIFNLWLPRMVDGLELADGESYAGKSGEAYQRYNEALNRFRDRYNLEPQALDIVLAVLGIPRTKPKEVAGEPKDPEEEISEPTDFSVGPFKPEAFDLMRRLRDTPTKIFYQAHKLDFNNLVQAPLQRVLREAAKRLPMAMQAKLETEKKLFSRIPKNDFGQGGAWPHYWGALYPKGGQRIGNTQLYVFLDASALSFGFSLPNEDAEAAKQFLQQAPSLFESFPHFLSEIESNPNMQYGRDVNGQVIPGLSFTNWLKNPKLHGFQAAISLPAEDVIGLSEESLIGQVATTFKQLYPLVQIAQGEELPQVPDPETDEDLPLCNPPYSIAECAKDTGLGIELLGSWVKALTRKGQAIIYGPPGTGKTYVAEHLAKHLVQEGTGLIELVQFHPAYAYEDFIQGIRPKSLQDGGLAYPTVPGRFMEFCKLASEQTGVCVLILDELNRANLSQVFGELMYLLEYRDHTIPLAGGGTFQIPNNVRLLGTMNTADRSIALVDHALRRRFAFLQLRPHYGTLRLFQADRHFDAKGLTEILEKINQAIADPHFELGISFFLREDLKSELKDIWEMEIEPYLVEFFYNQPTKVEAFRWEKVQAQILPK